MWLNEARTDIPIHLMSPNPGPGHGGMSCASPPKPTFSAAWRHNRNAKNAQSRAQTITLSSSPLIKSNPSMRGTAYWAAFRHSDLYAVCLKQSQEFINGLLEHFPIMLHNRSF